MGFSHPGLVVEVGSEAGAFSFFGENAEAHMPQPAQRLQQVERQTKENPEGH
jgi:hypothetical protein